MQFSDFFNVGVGLADSVKIVFFRMLPRGAQIEKVRAEINSGLLKNYGKMTKLVIDKENKKINADLDLKGESEKIQIAIKNYRLIQGGENLMFDLGAIESLITVLYVIAIMGALNLAAKKWKDQNKILAAYAYLFNIA